MAFLCCNWQYLCVAVSFTAAIFAKLMGTVCSFLDDPPGDEDATNSVDYSWLLLFGVYYIIAR